MEIEIKKEQQKSQNLKRNKWNITASDFSILTRNRIREVVEVSNLNPNPQKEIIKLTIGDPTIFGNLRTSPETTEALIKSVESGKNNGYTLLQGSESARQAIAEYSADQSLVPIPKENIFITNGCASAVEYCILALCSPGKNLLIPCPGYTLYETQAKGFNIELRYYRLLPEKNWDIDLAHLESLIDENTAAIIINNPSNPCGSVYSKELLESIVEICEKHYVPIISDEIYEFMVFPGKKHIPTSSVSKTVPVLTCSGLTKRFLVPGWRIGWIILHDSTNHLGNVILGLRNLSGRVLGSSCLIQGAIPDIFKNTPHTFFDSVMNFISLNAKFTFDRLSHCPGLHPIMSSGAMYMMIGVDIDNFPEFESDTEFLNCLINEQSVFCLPGSCFFYPNYFRIVLTVPTEIMKEACNRITEFCKQHYV